MKDICILGCSHTEGAELIDHRYIPNYWDFLKIPAKQYLNTRRTLEDYMNHWKQVEKNYNGDPKNYSTETRKLSWVARLKRIFKDTTISDYSHSGIGIDFFQYIYSNQDQTKILNSWCKLTNQFLNLRDSMINSDLLIWQITNEPRYFVDIKNVNLNLMMTNLADIEFGSRQTFAPKWQQKMINDYFIFCFNEEQFIQDKKHFLKYIAYKRALLGKKTLIVLFYHTLLFQYNLAPENSEYIHWLGFDGTGLTENKQGLVYKFVREGRIKLEETYCKFGHPTIKLQKLIGSYLSNYILKEGLLK